MNITDNSELHNDAFEAAKKLGIAFQLANFIRDVDEDLDRGRVYLPIKELAQIGVTREMLEERVAQHSAQQ